MTRSANMGAAGRDGQLGLTRGQANDVLRYWLQALMLEEALQLRPRARRTNHTTSPPRLDVPALGQEYFKLALDAPLCALVSDDEPLRRAFDGELSAFFESWLYASYRRGRDEGELSHLLCFPIVHLARGELAGLLRCGVRLSFGAAGGPTFRVPSRAERQRGAYPSPPDELRVSRAPRGEGSWPFFIDTRLLSYPLGLSSEAIDALFEALRAHDLLSERAMLTILTDALERAAREGAGARTDPTHASASPDDNVETLLRRLTRAMQSLLAQSQTRAQVYPVGIVLDGSQAKTSWHLQRELSSLLEADDQNAWQLDSCLGAYLTHRPLGSGELPQRALFPGPRLTPHQRRAAEHFWGSPLTAVQGPPGTGKTTVILHLCAEALVRQVDELLDKKLMGSDLLLIASSNNRAVDNVLDALSPDAGLPLALRVGSRQVCEHALSATLRRTLVWLRHAGREPPMVRAQALEQALALFARLRTELEAILAPRRNALARAAERERLQEAIAALASPTLARPRADLATEKAPTHTPQLSPKAARALDKVLGKLELRLSALSVLCEAKPSMVQVNTIARHFERTAERDLPAFEAAMAAAGRSFDVPLPPLKTPLNVSELMESWEEGAELFLERLAQVRESVEHALYANALAHQESRLRAQLEALGPAPAGASPETEEHDALSEQLFLAAVAVREAWAKVHASALEQALEAALQAAEQERSLRGLFRNDPERATLLCRLFGVWGSTLLSLGNCLPADTESVAHVVIDEAGQCHPAHAVSALMRAKSAMIIGDVHQLAPVIALSDPDEARLSRAARTKLAPAMLRPYRVSSESHVSAQSLADAAVLHRHALIDHFRCQPEIIAISDALCGYGLKVHSPRANHAVGGSLLKQPVSLRDVSGEQEPFAGSLFNQLELDETLALVHALLVRGVTPADVAVITPYRAQLERLRRGLLELRIPFELSPELAESEEPSRGNGAGLALGTVHRFQGGERSIVLFSSVVSRTASLPFLNTRPNLLNVAISRAQHHFVCLGHRSVLSQGAMTRLLVQAALPL